MRGTGPCVTVKHITLLLQSVHCQEQPLVCGRQSTGRSNFLHSYPVPSSDTVGLGIGVTQICQTLREPRSCDTKLMEHCQDTAYRVKAQGGSKVNTQS